MNPTLSALLAHPAIWRGGDCAPEPDALPTGFAALDEVLPGGGWPGNALTEIVLAREGIGELRLTLPTLAELTHAGREVVWVAPPYKPHAPALAAAGIALCRLALVRCRTPQEALWAFDQALRAPECGAAFAWLPEHDERVLRRLAVAAREGRTWGVLWRRPGMQAQAIAAPLRLALDAQDGQLAVKVLKRRGGELAKPVRIDLAARWSTAPAAAFATRRGPTDDRTGIDAQANRRGRPTLDAAGSRRQADEAEAIARGVAAPPPRAPTRPSSGPATASPDRRTSAGQAQAREGVLTRRVGATN